MIESDRHSRTDEVVDPERDGMKAEMNFVHVTPRQERGQLLIIVFLCGYIRSACGHGKNPSPCLR